MAMAAATAWMRYCQRGGMFQRSSARPNKKDERAAGQQADETDDFVRVKARDGQPLREQRSDGERQVQRHAAGARDESGVLTPPAGRIGQPQPPPDESRQRRGAKARMKARRKMRIKFMAVISDR